ncbi:MAG: hypothetical protein O8C61_02045 [Candidatus Methanoperedens sp.]|nr:hypothetical protein [Candidatus Methanoperedens sp.]
MIKRREEVATREKREGGEEYCATSSYLPYMELLIFIYYAKGQQLNNPFISTGKHMFLSINVFYRTVYA